MSKIPQTIVSQASTEAKPAKAKTPHERTPRLPSSKIARIKTLYLVKQWTPKDIADDIGITPKAVSQWIYRLKLANKRQEIAKRIEDKELAKATSEVEQTLERWSPQIEELGDDTLDLARKEVANPSKFTAKNLQAYSGAMRNWSAMVREFNGLKDIGPGNPAQVNIFVGSLERAEPKPADKPIDV